MSRQQTMVPWAKNATIYEVNLRQYTKQGDIKSFREHLPRIKSLGVQIIWFMPVQPIGVKNRKGDLGSYYSIKNYREINPEFGTFSEFQSLVEEIHSLGMYVILDWVANHTAWDHHWVDEHPDFYRRNELNEVFPPVPEWEDVIGLNYDNPKMRQQMIDEMLFWVENAKIDGFRCDMASLVPIDFWNDARTELNKHANVFMLAESEDKELLDKAFDVIYNWKVYHKINDMANFKCSVNDFAKTIKDEFYNFPENCSQLLFISNHDENSWHGSELQRLGLFLETMALLTFTLPGIPLIYSGMEAGNSKQLKFFSKDNIEWKDDKMFDFYKTLVNIRKNSNINFNSNDDGNFHIIETEFSDKIFCFTRYNNSEQYVVVVSLTSSKFCCTLFDPAFYKKYTDVFSNKQFDLHGALHLELEAYDYLFLKHINN